MAAPERVTRRVAERRAIALQLRAAGASYQQIADQLGHKSASNAVQDVTRALEVLARQGRRTPPGITLALELERLDTAERAVNQIRANARADPELALRAVDRILRISDRRARLLGLDPADLAAKPAPAERDDASEDIVDIAVARRDKRRRNRFSTAG
jgi:hypothetical protein